MRAVRVIQRVEQAGTIHLESLPLQQGQTVEIIVLPVEDNLEDLARLGESGLAFWDNEADDEAWNDVLPPGEETGGEVSVEAS